MTLRASRSTRGRVPGRCIFNPRARVITVNAGGQGERVA